jgi:phosphomannomutase
MAEPIISVSGLRGVVGESLTPDGAARFVAAFAGSLPDGAVLITRDGRNTGSMLASAVAASLMACGKHVLDAGVAATPTTGVLVRDLKCVGGIQISASHNPAEYNGLKLFSAAGRVIPALAGEQVLARYRSSEFSWVRYDRVGSYEKVVDTTTAHLKSILARVNVEVVRSAKFRVLLDSNHGAGSLLGKPLLQALGCDVIVTGDIPNGQFAHPPEPTAENLASVTQKIVSEKCAVGFCQDPDADRLAIIDEKGRYIGEEYTLALCLNHVLAKTPGNVVTNCSTSRMAQDIAAKYGVSCHLSAVGEANVVDAMLANQAIFGGEGNGGPIDPAVGFVRDSFIGMALVLEAMATRKLAISRLTDELPRYEIYKDKVTLPREKIAPAFAALAQHWPEAIANRQDGLRLDWPALKQWIIVRASNTEPIVRIIAEANALSTAQALCRTAAEIMSAWAK